MNVQEQIDHVKAALAAVNSAIAQTQAALLNASTVEDMQALQNTLIDLQAERSQLETNLIDLQAAQTEVEPLNSASMQASSAAPLNLSQRQITEVHKLRDSLKTSVVARGVTEATLTHATKVAEDAAKLRTILKSADAASRTKRADKKSKGV